MKYNLIIFIPWLPWKDLDINSSWFAKCALQCTQEYVLWQDGRYARKVLAALVWDPAFVPASLPDGGVAVSCTTPPFCGPFVPAVVELLPGWWLMGAELARRPLIFKNPGGAAGGCCCCQGLLMSSPATPSSSKFCCKWLGCRWFLSPIRRFHPPSPAAPSGIGCPPPPPPPGTPSTIAATAAALLSSGTTQSGSRFQGDSMKKQLEIKLQGIYRH